MSIQPTLGGDEVAPPTRPAAKKKKDGFLGEPLPDGFTPSAYTVLVGHGKEPQGNLGNQHLRALAKVYLPLYDGGDRKTKTRVVDEIVSCVRMVGGGFVKHRKRDGTWYEVDCHVARERVGYVMRDLLADNYLSSSKSKVERRKKQLNRECQLQHSCDTAAHAASTRDEDDRGEEAVLQRQAATQESSGGTTSSGLLLPSSLVGCGVKEKSYIEHHAGGDAELRSFLRGRWCRGGRGLPEERNYGLASQSKAKNPTMQHGELLPQPGLNTKQPDTEDSYSLVSAALQQVLAATQGRGIVLGDNDKGQLLFSSWISKEAGQMKLKFHNSDGGASDNAKSARSILESNVSDLHREPPPYCTATDGVLAQQSNFEIIHPNRIDQSAAEQIFETNHQGRSNGDRTRELLSSLLPVVNWDATRQPFEHMEGIMGEGRTETLPTQTEEVVVGGDSADALPATPPTRVHCKSKPVLYHEKSILRDYLRFCEQEEDRLAGSEQHPRPSSSQNKLQRHRKKRKKLPLGKSKTTAAVVVDENSKEFSMEYHSSQTEQEGRCARASGGETSHLRTRGPGGASATTKNREQGLCREILTSYTEHDWKEGERRSSCVVVLPSNKGNKNATVDLLTRPDLHMEQNPKSSPPPCEPFERPMKRRRLPFASDSRRSGTSSTITKNNGGGRGGVCTTLQEHWQTGSEQGSTIMGSGSSKLRMLHSSPGPDTTRKLYHHEDIHTGGGRKAVDLLVEEFVGSKIQPQSKSRLGHLEREDRSRNQSIEEDLKRSDALVGTNSMGGQVSGENSAQTKEGSASSMSIASTGKLQQERQVHGQIKSGIPKSKNHARGDANAGYLVTESGLLKSPPSSFSTKQRERQEFGRRQSSETSVPGSSNDSVTTTSSEESSGEPSRSSEALSSSSTPTLDELGISHQQNSNHDGGCRKISQFVGEMLAGERRPLSQARRGGNTSTAQLIRNMLADEHRLLSQSTLEQEEKQRLPLPSDSKVSDVSGATRNEHGYGSSCETEQDWVGASRRNDVVPLRSTLRTGSPAAGKLHQSFIGTTGDRAKAGAVVEDTVTGQFQLKSFATSEHDAIEEGRWSMLSGSRSEMSTQEVARRFTEVLEESSAAPTRAGLGRSEKWLPSSTRMASSQDNPELNDVTAGKARIARLHNELVELLVGSIKVLPR